MGCTISHGIFKDFCGSLLTAVGWWAADVEIWQSTPVIGQIKVTQEDNSIINANKIQSVPFVCWINMASRLWTCSLRSVISVISSWLCSSSTFTLLWSSDSCWSLLSWHFDAASLFCAFFLSSLICYCVCVLAGSEFARRLGKLLQDVSGTFEVMAAVVHLSMWSALPKPKAV